MVSGGLQDLESGVSKRWAWTAGNDNALGLLDFMNMALRQIAVQRPDCYSITESIRLEKGMLQKIPQSSVHGSSADAVALCELTRNMGSDGRTPGSAILCSHKDVTMAWTHPDVSMSRKKPREIDNYMYDRATNPNIYYVYPAVPNDAATTPVYVECTYYAQPPEITSQNDTFPISIGYVQAVVHHMLGMVLSMDNQSKLNAELAEYHRTQFQHCMDVKLQVDLRLPKANNSIGV